MDPDWYNFPDFLIAEFPELRQDIEEWYYFWAASVPSNPYPHLFLENLIVPMLAGTVAAEDASRARAGAVLDRVLVAADGDLAEAGLISVLELFRDNPDLREAAWPYLGPTAREWLQKMIEEP